MSKTVIVLGMHRSGTSLISNILIKLGVNMGDRLLGKNLSNPLGHFEDFDFLELNQKILASAGGDYKNPPSRNIIINQKNKFQKTIKNLIDIKNKKNIWGWKEPRTCLTFNLFLPYIKNPYIIYCKRDAEKIAQSLYKREEIEINAGLKLTQQYENEINNILKINSDLKKIEIKYEKLIENPKNEISKIMKFLEIELKKSTINKAVKCIKSKSKISKMLKRRKKINKIIEIIEKIEYKITNKNRIFAENNNK